MNTKHTPGPWEVQTDRYTVTAQKPGAPYTFVVAECPGYAKEREPNARLIAAAPEMYAALKWAGEILAEYVTAQTDAEREHLFSDLKDAEKTIAEALAKANGNG